MEYHCVHYSSRIVWEMLLLKHYQSFRNKSGQFLDQHPYLLVPDAIQPQTRLGVHILVVETRDFFLSTRQHSDREAVLVDIAAVAVEPVVETVQEEAQHIYTAVSPHLSLIHI